MRRLSAGEFLIPVDEKSRQVIAQRDHLRDPVINFPELRVRGRADFVARRISSGSLPKKSGDVLDRESDRERPPKDRNPPHDILGIRPIPVGGADRCNHAVFFVIADGVRADSASSSDFAGCHGDKIDPRTSSRVKGVHQIATVERRREENGNVECLMLNVEWRAGLTFNIKH